jgi:hypothetical protein
VPQSQLQLHSQGEGSEIVPDSKLMERSLTGRPLQNIYLGVTLDRMLQWTTHIFQKLKMTKRQLFMYKWLVGQHFEPQSQYMRWMYMGIVCLSYGAVVQWQTAKCGMNPENADTALKTSNDDLGPSAEKHVDIRAGNAGVSPPHGPLLTRSGQNMDINKEH